MNDCVTRVLIYYRLLSTLSMDPMDPPMNPMDPPMNPMDPPMNPPMDSFAMTMTMAMAMSRVWTAWTMSTACAERDQSSTAWTMLTTAHLSSPRRRRGDELPRCCQHCPCC